jgi:hypothetical protein
MCVGGYGFCRFLRFFKSNNFAIQQKKKTYYIHNPHGPENIIHIDLNMCVRGIDFASFLLPAHINSYSGFRYVFLTSWLLPNHKPSVLACLDYIYSSDESEKRDETFHLYNLFLILLKPSWKWRIYKLHLKLQKIH